MPNLYSRVQPCSLAVLTAALSAISLAFGRAQEPQSDRICHNEQFCWAPPTVRDAVFSLKTDCSLVGPFAGSYEQGWGLEYDSPDNTLWLTRGKGFRNQLVQTALGYRVNGEAHAAAPWYVTLEGSGEKRQLRIAAYAPGESEPQLIGVFAQIKSLTISCPNAVTEEKLQSAIPELERIAQTAIADGRTPGLAIGIVYKGRVVYLNGFGLREVGKPDLVDADTVFQLASVSKPISSAVVASLVSDGVVKWDDRMIQLDPEFRFFDPAATSKVTLADLFSHRSGLPSAAGDDLERVGYNQSTILKRLRFLPPAYAFRGGFEYSNFGLTNAAVVASDVAGERWPMLAQQRLFEPLGMTQTSMRYQDFVARANRAHLHILVNNRWTPLLTRDDDAGAPAGGASSSMRDLAQWLLFELADGQFEGKQLVNKQAIKIRRTPQAVVSPANGDTAGSYYGFGWNVGYLEDGVSVANHSGAFPEGASTTVTLLSSQDLGIAVLGNAAPTGVPESLANSFLDLARYGYLTRDWFALFKSIFARDSAFYDELKKQYSHPPVPNRPPLDFSAYVGIYRNDYVGKVKVSVENGALALTRGMKQTPVPLRHWDGNTFLSYTFQAHPDVPLGVEFTVDADGKASEVRLQEFEFNGSAVGTVTRIRGGQ